MPRRQALKLGMVYPMGLPGALTLWMNRARPEDVLALGRTARLAVGPLPGDEVEEKAVVEASPPPELEPGTPSTSSEPSFSPISPSLPHIESKMNELAGPQVRAQLSFSFSPSPPSTASSVDRRISRLYSEFEAFHPQGPQIMKRIRTPSWPIQSEQPGASPPPRLQEVSPSVQPSSSPPPRPSPSSSTCSTTDEYDEEEWKLGIRLDILCPEARRVWELLEPVRDLIPRRARNDWVDCLLDIHNNHS